MTKPILRLGTRGSPLALAQAAELRQWLAAAHEELSRYSAIETIVIRTSGDRITDRPLSDEGGKALFTKEIEEALLAGEIDIAIHSLKDMPTILPAGLAIACHLPREDARDALIAPSATSLAQLPQGASLATSSPRRAALALHARPDLRIVPLRGNVETRIAKLGRGQADAAILALAGLRRLGLTDHVGGLLSVDEMLPAAGQGAIAAEVRAEDARARAFLTPIDDKPTRACVTAERAVLAALGGDCRTPIAAFATYAAGRLALDALVVRPDGTDLHRVQRSGNLADATALGTAAGEELLRLAGPGFFDG
jgi:hydroxymethylbilane synthase